MGERDEFGAFLLGFIIGGVAGAATALLLAPQAGEETRTVIKDKAIELRDKASKTLDETLVDVKEGTAEARSKAEELYTTARKKATDTLRRGQVILEEGAGGAESAAAAED